MTIEQLIELEIKVRELVAELEQAITHADLRPPGQLDGTEGRLSRQDSLMRHQMEMEAQRRRQLRLQLLKEALHRMDAGTYGICKACGKEIEYSRLELQPEALVCSDCKNKNY